MTSGHGAPWKRLGDGSLLTEDADEGLGHLVPIPVFNRVFTTLVVLTLLTVVVSRFDFGRMNTVIAILIASIKAGLVATFFMHLKFEGKTIMMYAIYPLIVLSILIGATLTDEMDREVVEPGVYSIPATPQKANINVTGAAEHGSEHHAE